MFTYGQQQSAQVPGPETRLIVLIDSRDSEDINAVELDAILDTGADACCIPKDQISSLKTAGRILRHNQRLVRTIKGIVRVPIYECDVEFLGERYRKIELLESEKRYAIIGRNLLNHYKILLDGPNQRWHICKVAHDDC